MPDILVIDVGGSSVKLWHTAHEEHSTFDSGSELTPEAMCEQVLHLASDWSYEGIALGLPCRVNHGRPVDEPANLGPGWMGFNFASALGQPVRIINDACLQALGSYDGGRMLFLGLGTGVGSAFVAEGLVLSLGLGLVAWEDDPLWKQLCKDGLEEMSVKQRSKLVQAAIPQLRTMLLADYIVIGGGGAKLLQELPDFCRCGHNRTVVDGGRRLWEELPDPQEPRSNWVIH